jgi:hypothetical protein
MLEREVGTRPRDSCIVISRFRGEGEAGLKLVCGCGWGGIEGLINTRAMFRGECKQSFLEVI